MTPEAERFNGWAAMLGFVAAVGAYVTTGQIIPGWFQFQQTYTKCSLATTLEVYSKKPSDQNIIIYF